MRSTVLGVCLVLLTAVTASAQTKPTPPPKATTQARPATSNPQRIGVRGFGTLGILTFTAQESFDAILGTHSGMAFGGGVQVLLGWGLYTEVAASRFAQKGERVFVAPGGEIFPLGIATDLAVTPLEITGGWRYRHCPRTTRARVCAPKFVPYGAGGFSSYNYSETSEFSDSNDDVDERFNGFHIIGGADYQASRWVAVGGELIWASVPGAIGDSGVSNVFNEDNLGGFTLRLKVSVGR